VDITSGDPAVSKSLAATLAARGVTYVDAPVSGGPAGAAAGTLTTMVSGVPSEASIPALVSSYANSIVYVSPVAGHAHAVKAVNNTLNMLNFMSASEGLAALTKAGVPPERAMQAINGSSGRSLQSQVRVPAEVLSGRFGYGFSLGLMSKDVGIGAGFVQGEVLSAAFAEQVAAITERLGAGVDYTCAATHFEDKFGVAMRSSSSGGGSGGGAFQADEGVRLPAGTELLVCDMAGTTVDEGGIVYITLFDVMKKHGLGVEWGEMHPWHGASKIKVIEHFAKRHDGGATAPEVLKKFVNAVHDDFVATIEERYFTADVLKLIDPALPDYFAKLRAAGIKTALNTGYPIKIQVGRQRFSDPIAASCVPA
jgi:3-hydroxyisobutyrate dehydrogenase